MSIHPTAVVDSRAELGQGVVVGPFAFIDRDVRIGDGCVIGPRATVLAHTRLGEQCRVHSGAVLGDLPQDMAFSPDCISYVEVGDRSVFREGVTVHRGTGEGSVTRVGSDCLLMANSHVAHNGQIGDRVILANGALIAGYASVGERAFISGNCMVHQFTRVGRLAMMSGGSAIQKDLPPFCMTRSSASNTVMGMNVVGLRRSGFSNEERLELKRAFTLLYRQGQSPLKAIEEIESRFHSLAVHELCEFVRQSERGICRFLRDDD